MSNDWFRSWHGAPTDNKWLLIAKRAGVKPIHVSGTWWALLDHASQHNDRGFVGDFDVETFAMYAGLEDEFVSRIVTTLTEKGLIVDSRIGQWGKRQPKREDETAGDRQRRSRAKTGGKPPPEGGADIPDDLPKAARHAMSRNVTPDKTRLDKKEEGSEANASDASVVLLHPTASNFCKAVFDAAVILLVSPSRKEASARSLVGRMRKTVGDAELMILLREAENKSEPAEWLIAAVETHDGKRKPNPVAGYQPSAAVALLRKSIEAEAAERGDDSGDSGTRYALPDR